jgi:hypothetical protein
MHIKQFQSRFVRVPDPLRPGRYASEERLIPTGASAISHAGKTYKADGDGWFSVPMDVAKHMLSFRTPGSARFLTDADVGEHVRVGAASAEDQLPEPKAKKSA